MGKLSIPTIGKKGNTEHPKVNAAIEALNAILGEENKVKGSGVEEKTIADTNLASPNNAAYRTIFTGSSGLTGGKPAATYTFAGNAETPFVSGVAIGNASFLLFYFAKADYEVSGKTQKLRLRAQAAVNATKPTIKYTVGLYPVTTAGGAGEFKPTLGTVVSGSTVEFNEPAASTVTSKETADFTIPPDGAYALGFVTSAESTASSFVKLNAQLQMRSI